MDNAIQKLLDFLKTNPKSNKAAITIATGLAGLHLFNVLKKLQADGLVEQHEGEEKTYSLVEQENEESTESANATSMTDEPKETVAGIDNEPPFQQDKTEDANKGTESVQKPIVKSTGRDSSKLTFNGQEYGKGPLVRAVVAQYVADNPDTDYNKLKEMFPDDLLKRFGIFQDEATAAVIAKKGNRYFTKPEQVIKLKDKTVVVCNQFTLANIQPFLKVAKELGYEVK
ncbi:MAG: hypothetical protein BGO70_14365 [Bacteroidetes bacterium 43-93]|uniref:hypothetical protein n=1 Tax=uncultured Dysgonomonas sp. TaxID=206096 RepID=UPI00092AB935|nr:hypothetical protein [uncultured Dysgonomonas sp.]MBN9485527.1 hypothetical protein [Bacteroidota bacterium]OJW99609.1 MAG: hypothetical protein BGO70_14365 [Bacteroidetes bacterium 43-93]